MKTYKIVFLFQAEKILKYHMTDNTITDIIKIQSVWAWDGNAQG